MRVLEPKIASHITLLALELFSKCNTTRKVTRTRRSNFLTDNENRTLIAKPKDIPRLLMQIDNVSANSVILVQLTPPRK